MTTAPTTRTTPARGKGTPRSPLSKGQARDYREFLALVASAAGAVPCQSPDDGHQWISEDQAEAMAAAAKCRTCPVLETCGIYARTHHEPSGVWGGKTLNERQRPSRKRKADTP